MVTKQSTTSSRRPVILLSLLVCAMYLITAWLWRSRSVDSDGIQPEQMEYRIDPNQADIATLALLPGIGPNVGQGIVKHRESHGPFLSLKDLDEVPFVGPKTLERIALYVQFNEHAAKPRMDANQRE